MATMECNPCEAETPAPLSSPHPNLEDFFQSVTSAKESALLLDFDGTLAPFRIDPSSVRPWAGVPSLLDEIQQTGRTRLAIITGRPAEDVASQLGLRLSPEIWGLHGAERLHPSGRLERDTIPPDHEAALTAAGSALLASGVGPRLGLRVEQKWNAVVVHWRGKSPNVAQSAEKQILNLLAPFAGSEGMTLLRFDGGVELRVGRNKGDAVRLLLEDMYAEEPVAYLGDDTTDEDAFHALEGRGLGVLVRRTCRPSAAQLWLKPPSQLRSFLTSWLHALQG